MKNIFTVAAVFAALCFGTSAMAQDVNNEKTEIAVTNANPGTVAGQNAVRTGRVLAVDGVKLSKEDTYTYVGNTCGYEYANRWDSSARIYSAGKGLLISSAVTIPVGIAATVCGTAHFVGGALGGAVSGSVSGEIDEESEKHIAGGAIAMYCGAFLASVGVGTLIAGAVCVPVGKARMNDIARRCNEGEGYDVTMNFGPCAHGIGMTLNF